MQFLSKKKNSTIKLLYANVVFYHIESFSANRILNNVKINDIQEMFHVYLNKFENAVSHLFVVILGSN